MHNHTASMADPSGDDVTRAKFVLAGFYTALQAVCGYYVLVSAQILWSSVLLGSLFLGLLYLQFLGMSHFLVDMPAAQLAGRSIRHLAPSWCRGDRCYDYEAQDMASFFFVVFAHVAVTRRHPGIYKSVVCVVAFAVYMATLFTSDWCSTPATAVALVVGAVLGASKVFFFVPIVVTLYEYLLLTESHV
jgi:hypothetical protein